MRPKLTMQLEKIYMLWQREMKRFVRERSRIITSVVSPLLWIMIFGSGLRGSGFGSSGGGTDYRVFIFPGIIGMSLLFSGMFAGINVIWDRQFGFLKEVLVAPMSRTGIVVGKALGGATASMIQGVILLAFAPLVGAPLTVLKVVEMLPVMFLIALGIVCLGLLIAAFMESLEGFNIIMSFAIMPMFFFSGALYPLKTAPGWLQKASMFDPITYGVDALRAIVIGRQAGGIFSIPLDIAVLLAFATIAISFSTIAFGRNK
jgi:ABC-2 type transport system permease protein